MAQEPRPLGVACTKTGPPRGVALPGEPADRAWLSANVFKAGCRGCAARSAGNIEGTSARAGARTSGHSSSPIPTSCAGFVPAASLPGPRFPPRCSMARRGRRFESVRGLRESSCKLDSLVSRSSTSVSRGHSRALRSKGRNAAVALVLARPHLCRGGAVQRTAPPGGETSATANSLSPCEIECADQARDQARPPPPPPRASAVERTMSRFPAISSALVIARSVRDHRSHRSRRCRPAPVIAE
jgi:hypothetical protein